MDPNYTEEERAFQSEVRQPLADVSQEHCSGCMGPRRFNQRDDG